ncbi:MAG: SIS domain-containing protein, partial [Candidatus Gastranaerophilaceae bacterium]
MQVLDINKLACEVLDIEANAILRLKQSIGINFDKTIDLLFQSNGKVIITGMGKSGLIGKKIAATLTSTGTPSYFLHPAESTHGDSGIITRDDVVIAISNSGETQELLNLLPLIKRFGVPIISMTGNMSSTLAKAGDVVLDISVEREACPLGKAPTASTTATLAMGDALAMCLLEKRGF